MWSETVGLVNGQHKYLTAETFGFKINSSGVGLKKKQLWSIEPFPFDDKYVGVGGAGNNNFDDPAELEHVAIKSHLGCYLAVDNYGNVTCQERDLNKFCRFTITICSMSGHGDGEHIYWAFRNVERGYFLGAISDGTVTCNAKMPQSRAELWHVHLIPARGSTMFALKSVGRKRYARSIVTKVGDGQQQVQVDSTSPWGSETLFQFKYFEGGRYALLTSGGRYLGADGQCIDWTPNKAGSVVVPPSDALFTIEYHGGNIAFRDHQGRYLAGTGHPPVLRTRAINVSRDELFDIEHAPLQVALRANSNGKWVSIKQSFDVSANQKDITGQHETFELEYEPGGTWLIRSKEGNYWSLGAASAIQTSSPNSKGAAHFRLKWTENGSCHMLAANQCGEPEESMKWICARKSGQLYFGGADPVGLFLQFQNRTALNLRATTAAGFVGLKLPAAAKLEANKTAPDSVLVEYGSGSSDQEIGELDSCYLKMPVNGKYWSVIDGTQLGCDAISKDCAQQFILELRDNYSLAIRVPESNSYVCLTNQGTIVVKNCSPNEATLWDF